MEYGVQISVRDGKQRMHCVRARHLLVIECVRVHAAESKFQQQNTSSICGSITKKQTFPVMFSLRIMWNQHSQVTQTHAWIR